ncbi:MAG: hypothetical protein M1820_002101 [Bogoriella megaspora]|nr:MAG: hypothetical protein M1820_002101 [Bogoriella megaspora]
MTSRPSLSRSTAALSPLTTPSSQLCRQCYSISRHFSSTPQRSKRQTRLRRQMFSWLNGPGVVFREPLPNSTNYLGAYDRSGRLVRGQDGENTKKSENEEGEINEEGELTPEAARLKKEAKWQRLASHGPENNLPTESLEDLRPFPLNAQFTSQPVLSVELRDEIYRRVKDQGQDIRTVSAQLGVSIERVGAVVRLKAVEEDWIGKSKPLATPYQSAILSMLPTTPLSPSSSSRHEPINDISVHPSTRPQLFVPVSESRAFTRRDAALAFSSTLLPADQRIPHPELIEAEKLRSAGWSTMEVQEWEKKEGERRRLEREERERRRGSGEDGGKMRVVGGRRWDFRFEDIRVEDVGRDGLDRRGVGWRYGAPHDDRKRGVVKIPTSVG